MARKRVTASEQKQRHEWAIRQIDAGMGLSELTALTAETYGCSYRNAHDVVVKGNADGQSHSSSHVETAVRQIQFPLPQVFFADCLARS